jgi:hypothetical protein
MWTVNPPHRKVTSMDDLTKRALAAYVKSDGPAAVKVSERNSGPVKHKGRSYVVLRGQRGAVLAVYRYRTSDMLRRLKRWPVAIETMEGDR